MTRDDIQDLIDYIPMIDGYTTNATLQDIESALVQQGSIIRTAIEMCEDPTHRTKHTNIQMCRFLDSMRKMLKGD